MTEPTTANNNDGVDWVINSSETFNPPERCILERKPAVDRPSNPANSSPRGCCALFVEKRARRWTGMVSSSESRKVDDPFACSKLVSRERSWYTSSSRDLSDVAPFGGIYGHEVSHIQRLWTVCWRDVNTIAFQKEKSQLKRGNSTQIRGFMTNLGIKDDHGCPDSSICPWERRNTYRAKSLHLLLGLMGQVRLSFCFFCLQKLIHGYRTLQRTVKTTSPYREPCWSSMSGRGSDEENVQ